jgi:hypothetical protein
VHKWEAESSKAELEVNCGSVNSRVPGVVMPEPRTKRTARMRVHLVYSFSLYKSGSKSESELEPQYEPMWDLVLGLKLH